MSLVSIIVVNYLEPDLTIKCVESIKNNNHDNFEIIIIDNGSTENTNRILQKVLDGKTKLVNCRKNLGFSEGANLGFKHALQGNAKYIMVINNDTTVDKSFIQPLIDTIKSDSYTAAVAPKIYYQKTPNIIWAAGGEINRITSKAKNRGLGQKDIGQYDLVANQDYLTGCCILFDRDKLIEIGGFNGKYFAYIEDVEWSARARKKGYKLKYVPNSVIWHEAGATIQKTNICNDNSTGPFQHYLIARNSMWYIRTHITGFFKFTSIVSYTIRYSYYSIGFLVKRKISKLTYMFHGIKHGLANIENFEYT